MTKYSIAFYAFFLFFAVQAPAQDNGEYAAKNIKPELLAHANAVIRDNSTEMDIVSLTEVAITEHFVITVLNSKADKYADYNDDFSKLSSIQKISGCIYDEAGHKVTRIKESDFKDMPRYTGYAEYTDDRMKRYHVSYHTYPYTVEYTVSKKQTHTFYLPTWYPIDEGHCSLVHGSLAVTVHNNLKLNYKSYNATVTQQWQDGEHKYEWKVAGLPAYVPEPMCYRDTNELPKVLLAMNDFALGNYQGSMSSWKDYGKFIYELNKDRDVLPADIIAKVKELTAGITDDKQKIKVLYSYLQNTMRYVSVQYGIGGWQTLDATFLSSNNYGDCKALSNYMMALLEAAGIQGYPVIIRAGEENEHKIITDFVCTQFNHVILCVPVDKDTVWLECTSNNLPAGYLSDFTQDRTGVMITPSGGVVVHTPVYDTSVNLIVRHADVSCNSDGALSINISTRYNGEEAEHLDYRMKNYNDHDKEEYLQSKFRLPGYTVADYKYKREDNSPVMTLSESARLTATGMLSKTGSRTFISMDIAPLELKLPEETEERKIPFYMPVSNAECDTFELQIPSAYDVEYIPAKVAARYSFGSYSCAITRKDDKLVLVRTFTMNNGVYNAASYADYIKLLTLANNGAHKKVVLKSKA